MISSSRLFLINSSFTQLASVFLRGTTSPVVPAVFRFDDLTLPSPQKRRPRAESQAARAKVREEVGLGFDEACFW